MWGNIADRWKEGVAVLLLALPTLSGILSHYYQERKIPNWIERMLHCKQ